MLLLLFTALALFHMVGLYCSMTRVGHSGMTADEVTENIETAVKTAVAKIRMVSVAVWRLVFHHFGLLSWTNLPKIINEFMSVKNKSLIFGTFFMSWLYAYNLPFPPILLFPLLFTERASDEDHPYKESSFSGPAHLHLRPDPPQHAGEGRETCNDSQERGANKFDLQCSACVFARFVETMS